MADFGLALFAEFVDIFADNDEVTGIFDSADDWGLCDGVNCEHALRRVGLTVIEYLHSVDAPEVDDLFTTAIGNGDVKPGHGLTSERVQPAYRYATINA